MCLIFVFIGYEEEGYVVVLALMPDNISSHLQTCLYQSLEMNT